MEKKNMIIVIGDTEHIIPEGVQVRLSVTSSYWLRTVVYLSVIDGQIVICGGSSIIKKIEGEGMKEKVFS